MKKKGVCKKCKTKYVVIINGIEFTVCDECLKEERKGSGVLNHCERWKLI